MIQDPSVKSLYFPKYSCFVCFPGQRAQISCTVHWSLYGLVAQQIARDEEELPRAEMLMVMFKPNNTHTDKRKHAVNAARVLFVHKNYQP